MSFPTAVTGAALDRILAFLAPMFMNADMQPAAARVAAADVLATYQARNNRELRLAALAIAFGHGALAALQRAAAGDLPPNQVIRLLGSANTLSQAALQNEDRLDKLQGETRADDAPTEAEKLLPTITETPELVAFARQVSRSLVEAGIDPKAATPVSRQERRLLERQAEKVRRRQQEQERLAQRAAQRAAQRMARHRPPALQPA